MYRLLFQNESPARAPFATDESLLFIGRDTSCQLRLLESGVSDRHAAIERRDDGYYVRDLDSANGVRVNGQPVRGQRLNTGDELELGAVRLRFEVVHDPPRQRRRVDPLVVAAATAVIASLAGQIAMLVHIFSEPRPRHPILTAARLATPSSVAPEPEDTGPSFGIAPAPNITAAAPAPTTPANNVPAVLDRMIRITRVDRADDAGRVTLTLTVRAQVGDRELDTTQTAIGVQLFGFDSNGREHAALDPFWLAIPAWDNFTSKSFAIQFPLPPAQFAGYVVRTYYRGRLQDVAAMPPQVLAAPVLSPPGRP